MAAAVHLVADPGHHPHRPVAVVHLEVAAAHPVVVVSAALVHQALLPVDLHTVVLLQWAVGLVVDISLCKHAILLNLCGIDIGKPNNNFKNKKKTLKDFFLILLMLMNDNDGWILYPLITKP